MLQLTLFRHAKAETGSLKQDDHDRALASRGREDAPRVIQTLVQRNLLPELVLCSSALRCQQTWQSVTHLIGNATFETHEDLYLAEAPLLMNIAETRSRMLGLRSVMVIAHNPGLHELATEIAPAGDPVAAELHQKFPTAALAAFSRTTILDDWKLSAFLFPKALTSSF